MIVTNDDTILSNDRSLERSLDLSTSVSYPAVISAEPEKTVGQPSGCERGARLPPQA
jgi:hypothetical protein